MFDLLLIHQPPQQQSYAAQFNDIDVADYDIVLIDGVERKTQDILKALMTAQGSNLIFASYGTAWPSIGSRIAPTNADSIANSVSQTLGYLQAMETSAVPSERLQSIVSLTVVPGSDPRSYVLRLIVSMEDGSIATTHIPMPAGA